MVAVERTGPSWLGMMRIDESRDLRTRLSLRASVWAEFLSALRLKSEMPSVILPAGREDRYLVGASSITFAILRVPPRRLMFGSVSVSIRAS